MTASQRGSRPYACLEGAWDEAGRHFRVGLGWLVLVSLANCLRASLSLHSSTSLFIFAGITFFPFKQSPTSDALNRFPSFYSNRPLPFPSALWIVPSTEFPPVCVLLSWKPYQSRITSFSSKLDITPGSSPPTAQAASCLMVTPLPMTSADRQMLSAIILYNKQ